MDFKKSTWGKSFIERNGVYGEEILSAFIKVAGNGNCKAVWITDIPEAGKYEIFVYQSRVSRGDRNYYYYSNYPGMKNYYTVYTPEGSEEAVVERTGDNTGDWVSLGTFILQAGESHVVLDDRGIPPIDKTEEPGGGKYAQLVLADAVKWVKVSR